MTQLLTLFEYKSGRGVADRRVVHIQTFTGLSIFQKFERHFIIAGRILQMVSSLRKNSSI